MRSWRGGEPDLRSAHEGAVRQNPLAGIEVMESLSAHDGAPPGDVRQNPLAGIEVMESQMSHRLVIVAN